VGFVKGYSRANSRERGSFREIFSPSSLSKRNRKILPLTLMTVSPQG